MNMDPLDVMLAGTVMSTGGATSSKSGTWLRTLFQRSLDPKNTGSPEWHKLGLMDSHNQPTFVHNGVPSLTEFLTTMSENLAHMPLMEKIRLFKRFGERGGSALGMLAQPFMLERLRNLKTEMQDPDTKANWEHFQEKYNAQSPIQNFRLAMQDFNIALMEITKSVMPSVTGALKDFDGTIKHVKGMLPGGETKNDGSIGKRIIEGALLGGAYGLLGGPGGMLGGAIGGGVIGGVGGVAEQYMANTASPIDRFGRQVVVTGNSAAQAAEGMKALGDSIRGLHGAGSVFPGGSALVPSVSIILDGQLLGKSVSNTITNESTFSTGAPAADAMDAYSDGGHHQMDH
jgi:hypothetical protein